MNVDYIKIIIGAVGGLGLFLVGMKLMSEGMQAVAGERLRKLINAVTDNRLVACGVGATVTSLIQSSSVTTVMIVGMVNAGLMSLRQAIGVVLGADIETTITACAKNDCLAAGQHLRIQVPQLVRSLPVGDQFRHPT